MIGTMMSYPSLVRSAARSAIALLVLALGLQHLAHSQGRPTICGSIENPYGPYDFRRDLDKLPIVIRAHFTPEVQALIAGKSSSTPGGDIDYTLRAIPNHPQALLSMAALGDKERTDQPKGSRYTVDCWFDRAMRFRPDDHIVRMIYVNYLTKKMRRTEALAHLAIARKLADDNPISVYNVGLLYFDLQEYPLALEHAHKAHALGNPYLDLQEKLRAVGQWREPDEQPAAASAASAAVQAK